MNQQPVHTNTSIPPNHADQIGFSPDVGGLTFSPEERSLWPYEFSLALCLAVEGNSPQTTLEDFEE